MNITYNIKNIKTYTLNEARNVIRNICLSCYSRMISLVRK